MQSLPVELAAQAPQPAMTPDPVEQVLTAGLMTKYPDGNFHPEALLSRAQLATILVKTFQLDQRSTAAGASPVAAKDVPTSHWAYDNIQTVLKTGTMRGYRGDLFYPNQKITRAEALAIFAQAYGVFQFPDQTVESILAKYPDANQIPAWAQKAMATALYEGFVNSQGPDNRISPLSLMTRADLAYTLSQYLERQKEAAPL